MTFPRQRLSPLTTYLVFAYAASWVLWAPVVLMFPDIVAPPWWVLVLGFAGAYGPSVSAVATAAIHGGRSELRALFAKLLRWRVGWSWYVLALLGPPAFVWIGAAVHAMLGGTVGTSGMEWPLRATLVLATFIPFGPLGEELGWRGYALPRLERQLSPLVSSVTLGIIWAAWHIPMFWFPPVGLPPRSFSAVGVWTANVLSFSILLSYAARHTRYSIPIAVLLHATLNAGGHIGFAPLVAPSLDVEGIRSWAELVRWLVVLAVAVMLARERQELGAIHASTHGSTV
jgi:membrane protease YdiL (CAAX protease family)